MCPVCGVHPVGLVCDATAIDLDSSVVPGYFTTPDNPLHRVTLPQQLKFSTSRKLLGPKTRELLLEQYVPYAGKPKPFGPQPLPTWNAILTNFEGDGSLLAALQWLRNAHPAKPPAGWADLLERLCCDHVSDPVLIPPWVHNIVQKLVDHPAGGAPFLFSKAAKQKIEETAPGLRSFLKKVGQGPDWSPPSEVAKSVLRALLQISKQVFGHQVDLEAVGGAENTGVPDFKEKMGSFAPGFQQHSKRPFFVSFEDINGRSKNTKDDTKCRSKSTAFKGKGAKHTCQRIMGIMIFFCIHGFVYGFHIIKGGESPNDVFTILVTRSTGLRFLIYDNACKVTEYFLNRMPGWLKRCVLLVDTFHFGKWWNLQHKCGPHFFVKAYQALM